MPNHALSIVLELARSERLSAHDASYLGLAMRRGVPLGTRAPPGCLRNLWSEPGSRWTSANSIRIRMKCADIAELRTGAGQVSARVRTEFS